MNTLGSLWNKTTVGKLNEKRVFCLPPLSDPEPPVELNSEEEHGDEGDDDSGGEDCSSPNPKNDINITTGHSSPVYKNTPTSLFKRQYDKTQQKLKCIAAMDDLLSGTYYVKST